MKGMTTLQNSAADCAQNGPDSDHPIHMLGPGWKRLRHRRTTGGFHWINLDRDNELLGPYIETCNCKQVLRAADAR